MSDTNGNLLIEGESALILEKSEAENQGIPLFFAHWHIFAPTILIFIGYSVSWYLLLSFEMSGTHLGRLFIIVMSVFVPLLAAHAFLRFQTIRLQINPHGVVCHPGWPKDLPIEVPFAMIEDVAIKRGISGRMLGGGSLILTLPSERKLVISDLSKPEEAKKLISEAIYNN
jgi:membrane protein YdbS with pleckstrin-like domain